MCHQALCLIGDVALDQSHGATLSDHPAYGAQASFPDRLEKVDLEFKRRERLSVIEIRRIGNPHRGVGNVAEHATVQRTHRVGVRLGSLELDNGFAGFDRDEIKADQAGDRRRGRVPPHDGFTAVEHLCHNGLTK
jgi:hypothetical protein